MKRFTKIFILLFVLMVSCVCFVACGDTPVDEKGIKYKQYENGEQKYYVVVGYNGTDTELEIPSQYNGLKVGRIKKEAFAGNDTIKKLVVPSGVSVIDEEAFGKMKALNELTIPFVGKYKNAESTLNDNNVSEEEKAANSARTFGYVFSTSEYDGGIAITQSYNDATTTDSEGNTTASGTFTCYLPAGLKTVNISPDEDYSVPAYAFKGNGLIVSVNLSDKVKVIGEHAFENCKLLNFINVSKSVTEIKDSAFKGCQSLSDKNIFTQNDITVTTGLVFDDNSTLKIIGDYAFGGTALTELVLPDSVEKIGKYAFASIVSGITVETYGASALRKVVLSASIKEIGEYAFFRCEGLKEVQISSLVADDSIALGSGAFSYCNSLTKFGSDTEDTVDLTKLDATNTLGVCFGFISRENFHGFIVIDGSFTAAQIQEMFLETDRVA